MNAAPTRLPNSALRAAPPPTPPHKGEGRHPRIASFSSPHVGEDGRGPARIARRTAADAAAPRRLPRHPAPGLAARPSSSRGVEARPPQLTARALLPTQLPRLTAHRAGPRTRDAKATEFPACPTTPSAICSASPPGARATGPAIGCVVDGCPPLIPLTEADIQPFIDKRRPGQSRFTTQRREPDTVRILSGVFRPTPRGRR